MNLKFRAIRILFRLKKFAKSYKVDQIRTIYFLFIVIILGWTTWSWFIYESYNDLDLGDKTPGVLGDSYGVVTSFFSALAFAGLLYTLLLQRKELAETRNEFKKQNETLKYQKFDNTFFNMMNLQHNILENAGGVNELSRFIRDNFSVFREEMNFLQLRGWYRMKPNISDPARITRVQDKYGSFISHFETTVDFIITSKRTDVSRAKYLRIYSAQLNNLQKIILFYHLNFETDLLPTNYQLYRQIMFGDLWRSNHIFTEVFRTIYAWPLQEVQNEG